MAEIIKPLDLSKTWASSGEKTEPTDTKKNQGWIAEIPTYSDFNWLDGRQDEAIAHINQHGIAMWDSTTEYQAGKSFVMGSDGNIYVPKTTHVNVDPIGDLNEVNWILRFVSSRRSLPTIEVPLVNGWQAFPTTVLRVGMSDGALHLYGGIFGGSTSIIGSIPARYRPSVSRSLIVHYQTGSGNPGWGAATLAVNADGLLTVSNGIPNNSILISGSILY